MSAFERESPQTIEMLWTEYHRSRSHTTAKVLSATLYRQLIQNARNSPFFIFPVPKLLDNSHFVLVSQAQEKSFVLTWLDEYRQNPQAANPYMVLTCFDELTLSKGVGLMRGDVIQSLSRNEGRVIMEQVMDTYMTADGYEKAR